MKKLLTFLLLLPYLIIAQSKSDWRVFNQSYEYESGTFLDPRFKATGYTDILLLSGGSYIYSSPDRGLTLHNRVLGDLPSKVTFIDENGSRYKPAEGKKAKNLLLTKKDVLWFSAGLGLHYIEGFTKRINDTYEEKFVPLSKEMPFEFIDKIAEDKKGNIWVSGIGEPKKFLKFEPQGISKFDGTSWRNMAVTGQDGKPLKVVNFVFDDQDNPILFVKATAVDYGITIVNGSGSTDIPWPKATSIDAAAFINGTLYVAKPDHLMAWKDNKWEEIIFPFNNIAIINDIQADKDGNIWLASSGGVVTLQTSGAKYYFNTENSPLPAQAVRKVSIDENNIKWFATDLGIVGFKEPGDMSTSDMKVYTKYNSGLPGGEIKGITSQGDNLYTVTAGAGITKFDGNKFVQLAPSSEFRSSFYSSLASDKKGNVYAGVTRFIHKYDGTTYTNLEWKDDIGKNPFTVLVDNKDQLWMAADGISKYDGATWQNFNKKNAGLSSNTAYMLFQDSKNNIWAALSDGIGKYDGTAWTIYNKKTSGFGLGNMRGIAEGKDGKMYFSNGVKLIEFDGTTMTEKLSLKPASSIRNMVMDADGTTLLLATEQNGIVKVKDGVVTSCNVQSCGLPSNAITWIYRDGAGKIWAAFGSAPEVDWRAQQSAMLDTNKPGATKPVVDPKDELRKKLELIDLSYGLMQINIK